jgi:hypothetical protein
MNRDWLRASLSRRELGQRFAVLPRSAPLRQYLAEPAKTRP